MPLIGVNIFRSFQASKIQFYNKKCAKFNHLVFCVVLQTSYILIFSLGTVLLLQIWQPTYFYEILDWSTWKKAKIFVSYKIH